MFAEPCVFSKQSLPPIHCDPFPLQPRGLSRTYGYPLFRSYGVNLPSSLAKVLSRALVFSTHPRVSVSVRALGRQRLEAFLGSMDSITLWGYRPSYSLLRVMKGRICLPFPPTSLNQVIQHPADLSFSVTPSLKLSGTGILTCFPSTTPFGLALGID